MYDPEKGLPQQPYAVQPPSYGNHPPAANYGQTSTQPPYQNTSSQPVQTTAYGTNYGQGAYPMGAIPSPVVHGPVVAGGVAYQGNNTAVGYAGGGGGGYGDVGAYGGGYGGTAYGGGTMMHADLPIEIRHGFIRKVYTVLSIQLLITFGIGCAILYAPGAKTFLTNNSWLFILALVLTFGTLIALSCCSGPARTFPLNYVLLLLFTAAQGFLVGVVTTQYDITAVGVAVGITAGVFIACTLFAIQTKIDFTSKGGYLFVALIVLLLFGIIAAFFIPTVPILQKVYGAAGALIFSLYLVYDTQLLVGGKHRTFEFSVDDYVFAALALYIDIINIFLFILMLFGGSNND
ncbi:unnamed protein product [Vitrella brassicaformis CCMP3155]|uniref:Uncharacterized protein n=1 Tax=Vitrella brassicaformis (strain CCMP3155) TaxID=1169540 RepID=A0A0G4EQ09_VITBC|nr:unnamed protein product [Vitrella brassicaformis CCMP3155]|mmetsp:Transcript_24474/g.60466  ORF Transcript_24474/g.60466 Transcript_24474/m.60466 type:complete len:347 (-) Transcript_24474:105-1145(-)|eukprot:CEL99509.1 unnamed protein product [Vitrella brassicaformis CCMP3155]